MIARTLSVSVPLPAFGGVFLVTAFALVFVWTGFAFDLPVFPTATANFSAWLASWVNFLLTALRSLVMVILFLLRFKFEICIDNNKLWKNYNKSSF
jgi:hypothetical protein